jgi:GNAT superfamily N-acetyltransferase
MPNQLTIKRFTGRDPELRRYMREVAGLRIQVFREFPYLYDGSYEYEDKYLQTYTNCGDSVIVLVLDGDKVVGASTAIPLEAEVEDFQKPFIEHGYDVHKIFYCGESVLLKEYRGRGVYSSFFAEREGHARALGRFDLSCFCAVRRETDHPRRPADYVPLDRVWTKYGYAKHPDLWTTFTWKDLDEERESPKVMEFWLKSLKADA